jgi:4-hydroxy-tetrahydrodipicolinate synthase
MSVLSFVVSTKSPRRLPLSGDEVSTGSSSDRVSIHTKFESVGTTRSLPLPVLTSPQTTSRRGGAEKTSSITRPTLASGNRVAELPNTKAAGYNRASESIRANQRLMAINLRGVLLPITTPFSSSEELDTEVLAGNIERWNDTGIAGYVILGSTGERVNLDESEYLRVIETARRSVPEKLTFIAGAGQQSTRGTIKEIDRAAAAGAAAVLVITPSFYKSAINQEALVGYYWAVADAARVPVILYSMPDLTGITIEPETAARLSEHENIIGMKDSSADIEKFAETVRQVRDGFAIMIGNGTVFSEALQAGARGGILAVGCAAPKLCVEIYEAVRGSDTVRAKALQDRLTPLARAVTKTYGIGGLKTAMDLSGLVGGAVRSPLRRPDEAAAAEIARLLNQANDAPDKRPTDAAALSKGLLAGT